MCLGQTQGPRRRAAFAPGSRDKAHPRCKEISLRAPGFSGLPCGYGKLQVSGRGAYVGSWARPVRPVRQVGGGEARRAVQG